ncbi:MAG: LCP family protein [Oscillospiraceae bacterium]|nr:LCP family protein [Oscillospiraceae bacterium]
MNNNKTIKKAPMHYRTVATIIIIIIFFTAIIIFGAYNLLTKKPVVDNNVPFSTNPLPPGEMPEFWDESGMENISGYNFTRKKDVYNFLVCGESDQTDTMMIINYDVANQKINVVQIPRDTYINAGRNFNRINSYFTGEYNRLRGEENRRYQAMENLTDFIEQNLTLQIDWWVCINTEVFRNIVDIIGGVEVDVPYKIDYEDPYQDLYIHLEAGLQTLDGAKAEQFVRFRSGYALQDFGRMDAQKIFMTALLKKVKTSLNVTTITKIAKEAIPNIETSITAQQMIYFASQVLKVNMEDVTMLNLHTTSVESETTGALYEVLHRADTLKIVNTYLNVYAQDIPNAIFDRNRVFTNTAIKEIHDVYTTVSDSVKSGQTAAEIDENSIYIIPQR